MDIKTILEYKDFHNYMIYKEAYIMLKNNYPNINTNNLLGYLAGTFDYNELTIQEKNAYVHFKIILKSIIL